ncbi:MAG: mismatch endonuclease, patch repair protein [Acidobacteriota bacterium]|jgi:DNA mismatch endonuclease (patch repair protein)|nr:mismatch endonuclease, patch repair protein [Acidobacteriota bacterium]
MDRVNKETRSKVMSAVRSKGTRLEEKLVGILNGAGLTRHTRYLRGLPGTPDIAFEDAKVAVFLDSCFWHGCPKHLRMPSTNTEYWQSKIEKNIKRDHRQRAALRRLGWRAIGIWEHDLHNPQKVLGKVRRFLEPR